MAVGMTIDLPLVARESLLLIALLLALMLAKGLLISGLCLAFRLPAEISLRVGPLLSQGGEFGFVLVGGALASGLIDRNVGQLVLALIALSMAVTPLADWLGLHLARLSLPRTTPSAAGLQEGAEEITGHVIIAGFGRVGQTVAHVLSSCGVPYVALDMDYARVARGRAAGLPLFFGDASRVDLLEAAGIERAKAAVITIDRAGEASRAVQALHQRMPDLPIFVRSHDMRHARDLEAGGASAVVPETVEASLQIGGIVLSAIGVSADDITRVLNDCRNDNYLRLGQLAEPQTEKAESTRRQR